jgi:hypothetical protein
VPNTHVYYDQSTMCIKWWNSPLFPNLKANSLQNIKKNISLILSIKNTHHGLEFSFMVLLWNRSHVPIMFIFFVGKLGIIRCLATSTWSFKDSKAHDLSHVSLNYSSFNGKQPTIIIEQIIGLLTPGLWNL